MYHVLTAPAEKGVSSGWMLMLVCVSMRGWKSDNEMKIHKKIGTPQTNAKLNTLVLNLNGGGGAAVRLSGDDDGIRVCGRNCAESIEFAVRVY